MAAMFNTTAGREKQYFIAALIFVVLALGMTLIRFPSGVPTVSGVVGRGSNVLVVRFPESANERREEIILRDVVGDAPSLLRVFVTTGEQTQQGIRSEPTPDQLAGWRRLRTQWCEQKQIITSYPKSQPTFDVALRCPLENGYLGHFVEFRIAANELPVELRELIRMVPSPGCKDPLCGW